MSVFNKLVEMDHEVGKSNSPPKMMSIDNYFWWKGRFEEWARFYGYRMWLCIEQGYFPPSRDVKGGQGKRMSSFKEMSEEEKRMLEAENKACAAITMSLPQKILHTFSKNKPAKELWDLLTQRFMGSDDVKKNKKELLKKQFAVFKHFKYESLEEIITRFYHLLTELSNHELVYDDSELNDKIFDALPTKWDMYTLMIKEGGSYSSMSLDTVVRKLRAYNFNMMRRDAGSDQVQDPGIYHGKAATKTSSSNSSSGVSAFFSGETSGNIVIDSHGECCFVSTSGELTKVKDIPSGKGKGEGGLTSEARKSMPMSVKSAEQ